jgi:hypothetical protein
MLVRYLVTICCVFAAATGAFAGPSPESSDPVTGASTDPTSSFAVVELFTSQGCNSCPRADAALARLVEDTAGLAVYPLEWHVDYWDYLGWPDPYAIPEAAQRQRRYGQVLASGVYTPQMVLNGRAIVRPAQDYSLVRSSALGALGPDTAAADSLPRVTLAGAERRDGTVRVSYAVADVPAGCTLLVAAVEGSVENHVPRGENAGKTLLHRNVVRGFSLVNLSPGESAGEVTITLPEEMAPGSESLIAYVQRQNTLGIVAATAHP